MKKMITTLFVSVVMAVNMIGNMNTVNVHAEDTETITMAEVVAKLKEGYGKSVVYSDDETRIEFSWDVWSEMKFDAMIDEITGTGVQFALEHELDERGMTLNDYRDIMTNWHVVTEVSYHPFTTIVMV